MKWFKLSLLVIFPLTLLSSAALATSICLNARATNDPMSGHAFVTILNNSGQVIQSYGFWPESKHPGYVAINKTGDMPMAVLLNMKNVTLPPNMLKMKEESFCQEIDRKILPKIRAEVDAYLEEYGVYRTLSNNCTHFAIRIFNAATGVDFPVVQTPKRTIKIIESLN